MAPASCACRTDDPDGCAATRPGGGRRLLFATLLSSYEPELPQAVTPKARYGTVAHCCCLAPATMTTQERENLAKKVTTLQNKLGDSKKCPGHKKCNKWASTVDSLTVALGNEVGGRCTETKSTQWCASQGAKNKCNKWKTWTKCMATCGRC